MVKRHIEDNTHHEENIDEVRAEEIGAEPFLKEGPPEGAPIAGASAKVIDRETLSHQWQGGVSPAIDTNVLSDHPNRDLQKSVLDTIDKEDPEAKKQAEQIKLRARLAKGVDCSTLDVSDPLYCQPDSEDHKAYLAEKKKDK